MFFTKYKNRQEAAEALAIKLNAYKDNNTLVLGIPRGGVETAYYLAKALLAELSVLVTIKLDDPRNADFPLGALAEENELYINKDKVFTRSFMEAALTKATREIKRRVKLYRDGSDLPEMKNRNVILVDDGISSGATMVAALQVCRKHHARKLVVTAPINSPNIVPSLYQADELVFLQRPLAFHSVEKFYDNFPDLTDEDVLYYLNRLAVRS